MSWAKFDDLYDDNRKVKRAWRRNRGAVGLHAMAVTYCARHETDGVVDIDWLEDRLPKDREREQVLAVLVDVGLFEVVDDEHWRVHDYLEYNDSAAGRAEKREEERRRKSEAGKKGARVRWGKPSPDGTAMADGMAGANGTAWQGADPSIAPDPTRPDPTHSPPGPPPSGGRQRAKDAWEEKATLFAAEVLPHLEARQAFGHLQNVWFRTQRYDATVDELREIIEQRHPELLEAAA